MSWMTACDRACSTSCTRLVPVDCCLFAKQTTRLRLLARLETPSKAPNLCPEPVPSQVALGNQVEGFGVTWSHDAEVSAVERCDRREIEAFRNDDQAGVGAAKRKVSVGVDQVGDSPRVCGRDRLDLEFAVGHGAEERSFSSRAELAPDEVGRFGDHERRGYEWAGVLNRRAGGLVIGIGVVGGR